MGDVVEISYQVRLGEVAGEGLGPGSPLGPLVDGVSSLAPVDGPVSDDRYEHDICE